MSETPNLVAMALAAKADDRLSTGALYGDLADRITALEAKLREILTDATSLPHALTIAREGLHGEGGE